MTTHAAPTYELPNLGAVNFLIRGLLGAGATSTLRLDSQAKALGEWLRARSTRVPRSPRETKRGGPRSDRLRARVTRGVNPSLTITALTEHAMTHVPPSPKRAASVGEPAERSKA